MWCGHWRGMGWLASSSNTDWQAVSLTSSLLRRQEPSGLRYMPCRLLHCRTLIKAIALRGYKPGLGPAAEILSLRRQRKNSKKGDPGAAAPTGFPFAQYKKWESPKTRYAQTSAFLFPFSVLHKRRLHMGTAESQKQPQSQKQRQYDHPLNYHPQPLRVTSPNSTKPAKSAPTIPYLLK